MEPISPMLLMGRERYCSAVVAAKEKTQESKTSYGSYLVTELSKVLYPELERIKEAIIRGEAGYVMKEGSLILGLPVKVWTVIGLKAVIDSISQKRSLSSAAVYLGGLMEDELRCRDIRKTDKDLWNYLEKKVKKRVSYYFKRCAAFYSKRRIPWLAWTTREQAHVGLLIINAIHKTTGLIDFVVLMEERRKTCRYIVPTLDTLEWIRKFNEQAQWLKPIFTPSEAPCVPWTSLVSGGYQDIKLPLVKTRHKGQEGLLDKADLSIVMKAVNRAQATRWEVNYRVLDVFRALHASGVPVAGLPSCGDIALPDRPEDFETNEAARKSWRQAAAQCYSRRAFELSERLAVGKTLWVANNYHTRGCCFPAQLDFRGRLYYSALFLNPQGSDLSRGLLGFSDKKKVTTEGAHWLKWHGENMFGKGLWEERTLEDIYTVADDPLGNRWWTDCKKPWQFLAWCFDYTEAMRNPEHLSGLPIYVDATSSGLQIISIMCDSPLPATDFYSHIATKVTERMKEDRSYLAALWLQHGVSREAVKAAVMAIPYGASPHTIRHILIRHVRSLPRPNTLVESAFPAVGLLVNLLWAELEKAIPQQMELMRGLRETATKAAAANINPYWVSPSGFPVLQPCEKSSTVKILFMLLGRSRASLNVAEGQKDTLDPKRIVKGFVPNLIHSIDAAVLHHTLAGLPEEIKSISVIHDCFGGVAADMTKVFQAGVSAYRTVFKENPLISLEKDLIRQEINTSSFFKKSVALNNFVCNLFPVPPLVAV